MKDRGNESDHELLSTHLHQRINNNNSINNNSSDNNSRAKSTQHKSDSWSIRKC